MTSPDLRLSLIAEMVTRDQAPAVALVMKKYF
jgi:hypothetical protein